MDGPSELSKPPYINPLMTINQFGTCATAKIMQCRYFGCHIVDVSRKSGEDQDPDDVPDLYRDDFLSRKNVIGQVARWDEQHGTREQRDWIPIAYLYKIVQASAKRTKDWGHVLFTNPTTTRFLLVMIFPVICNCGNFSHHDYDTMTKHHADRLMSLLRYLPHRPGHPPEWVRATYVTPWDDYALTPQFLNSTSPPTPSEMRDCLGRCLEPTFHITWDNFVPSLLPSDVEKIDNLLSMTGAHPPVPVEICERVVCGKDAKPHVCLKAFSMTSPRECDFCQKELKEKGLMVCSRCKLVFYCGRACQRRAWPHHKQFCKPETPSTLASNPKSVPQPVQQKETLETSPPVQSTSASTQESVPPSAHQSESLATPSPVQNGISDSVPDDVGKIRQLPGSGNTPESNSSVREEESLVITVNRTCAMIFSLAKSIIMVLTRVLGIYLHR